MWQPLAWVSREALGGGRESAAALLPKSGCVLPILRMETWGSEKYVSFLAQCWFGAFIVTLLHLVSSSIHLRAEKTVVQGGGITLQGSLA